MLGHVKTANINPTHTNTDLWDWTQFYFVNDDWNINSRLTVNVGLRYDYFVLYV
jgi:outer membrane receptor protein involved in Fe transport